MSAGHHADRNDVPVIDDDFYRRVTDLVDAARVDRDHTIPWLANRSIDGRVVFIDECVPVILPKTQINTGLTLPYHELGEWLGMNEGKVYDEAHQSCGNPCEKRRVEELGGDWQAYQEEIEAYVREVADEAMTSVPADIDKRVFVDDDDKAALEAIIEDNKGFRMTAVRKFLQGAVVADATLGERQIRVVASDPTVDRVKDVMVPEGCVLDNYKSNPIVLANHDADHPIGRAVPTIQNGRLEALIEFAPKGISVKADEYCGLYKCGVMSAVSVGFDPIDVKPIKDGGLRYEKWELMEISCVSVPANPAATVIQRALSAEQTNKADKHEWKVGASRNLSIDEDSSWDGAAAKAAIFEHANFDGDKPDTTFARKGFLVYDAANPKLKGSYKLPFATVKDGRLVAIAAGIRNAASRLPQTDIPDDVAKKARAVIDHYEAKMKDGDGKGGNAPRTKTIILGANGKAKIKGLYHCAELARVLNDLGFIQDMAKWEAEAEGDDSKLPAMLAAVMKLCADALVAMTQEETAELLAGRVDPLVVDVVYVEAAATPQAKNLRAAFRKAGRVLSEANMNHLAEMQKCFGKMADCYQKAADLHDDLHDQLVEWQDHGTSAGEHAEAMVKSAKPAADAEQDPDPANADNELAFEAEQRKRQVELMATSAA
jgi:HK97 family phage prohead protease